MNGLKSGWSPTQRQRLGFRIGVAVLLLTNPFYIGILNIDLTGTTYSVEPVTIDNGTIELETRGISTGAVPGIDCSGSFLSSGCAYERARVQAGQFEFTSESAPIEPDKEVAYHPTDGQAVYYQRTVNLTAGSRETLVLEPISPETALEQVAVPESSLSVRMRVALIVGSITTESQSDAANQVIKTDHGYVAFVPTSQSYSSSGQTVEMLVSALLLIGGVVLLWKTYKRFPTE